MRLVFAGTPVFAARALAALLDAGHDVALVLTRPDRPAGRGQKLLASPVKQLAQARGLSLLQPRSLRDADAQRAIRDAAPEAMVVAAYGLLLPAEVLAIPPRGCLNIHASLLPRWRGAAPIQRAVAAGDPQTGITIMQMDEGLDTGPMLLTRVLPIGADEAAGSVHDRLAVLGAQAIVEALAHMQAGTLAARPQPAEGVTHAAKIGKADAIIDWGLPAPDLVDRIRALDPAPGAVTALARAPDVALKVWRARAVPRPHEAAPGTVLAVGEASVTVACGRGAVELLELQRPGGRRLAVPQFLRGHPLHPGDRLQAPAGAAG